MGLEISSPHPKSRRFPSLTLNGVALLQSELVSSLGILLDSIPVKGPGGNLGTGLSCVLVVSISAPGGHIHGISYLLRGLL